MLKLKEKTVNVMLRSAVFMTAYKLLSGFFVYRNAIDKVSISYYYVVKIAAFSR